MFNFNSVLPSLESMGKAFVGHTPVDQLLRGGLGAYAAYRMTPHYQLQTPISASTLDAATVPIMQRQLNGRLESMNANLGAKGGLSASDIAARGYDRAAAEEQIAHQQAMDQITANNSLNQTMAYNNQARMQPFQNAMAGGLIGANAFMPATTTNPMNMDMASRILMLRHALGQ